MIVRKCFFGGGCCLSVCVCVIEREREKKRDRESVCVCLCGWERERERERERDSVCVCVCVSERERDLSMMGPHHSRTHLCKDALRIFYRPGDTRVKEEAIDIQISKCPLTERSVMHPHWAWCNVFSASFFISVFVQNPQAVVSVWLLFD